MSPGFRIGKGFVDEMIAHCAAERPNEGCGLLATKDGEVVKVFLMTNASRSPVRYSLDGKEQFNVYQILDQEGWELGGVFHSHTRTEAYPSPTDVREARELVPYVIISFATEPPTVRAFDIKKQTWTDEHGSIVELPVEVV